MESDLSLIGCALGLAVGKLYGGKGSICAYWGNGDVNGDANGDMYDKTYGETKGEVVREGEVVGEGEVIREGEVIGDGEVIRELRAVD